MNDEATNAVRRLTANIEILMNLYPEMEYIGTPAYMCNGTRLHFSVKLRNGRRKSIQYARLLLECKIGRRLVGNETVDHIDGDVTNNDVDNLQILTRSQNASKGPSLENKLKKSLLLSNKMKNKKQPWNDGELNGCAKLTNEQINDIKNEQLNHYRGQDRIIADRYGVSRELISHIRHGRVRISPE